MAGRDFQVTFTSLLSCTPEIRNSRNFIVKNVESCCKIFVQNWPLSIIFLVAILVGEDVSRLSVDHGNVSRRNPSNWLSSDTDEDEGEGDDLFVESTPPQRRGIV